MKIIVADNSGFCFGVRQAIDTTLEKIKENNGNIYSLGPLIHNKQETNRLKNKGLEIINNIDKINNKNVVIRSHGIPLNTYDIAKKNNVSLVDCTCPFVRNIQKKAHEYYNKGYAIVIIGKRDHPEVIGINGWCENNAYIVNSKEDIEDIPKCDKICIVAQTTITQEKFNYFTKLIEPMGEHVEVFNTICNATRLRQQSCENLAKHVDAMIVIGGYHSSNTQKLVDISKKYCRNTYHVETAEEIPISEIKKFKVIGVTAGASTPEWIIKEVIDKMNNDNNMNEMMEAIENSMVELNKGDVVKGTVISINRDEVMVNLGYKSDGIIKRDQLSNDPDVSPEDILSEGDEIEVYIYSLDDGDGNVVLSKKKVDDKKNLDKLEDIYNNEEKISAKIIEAVKGGVIALVNDIRGFIPASHLSTSYVKDLNEFIDKVMDVKVIELDKNKRRIILSRKVLEEKEVKEKRERLWNSLEKGKEIVGIVKRLTNFGAFVDIGGVDGLIHISDLSWGRIDHPREVVKEEDKVNVIVLDFDKEKGKISLGLKQTIEHPWKNISDKYKVGDVSEGKVVNLVDFGAFVELEPGLDGLVHISQISDDHIAKPSDKLAKGDSVKVKIIEIDEDEERLSLSMKEVDKENNDSETKEETNGDNDEVTIGDIIKEQ
ncbi:bifunctional 4-hydroxy-3-methylbut-2-enyl diphosphate reductase/30S ribosomal protein S1 [Dethiothermospora halolimnae]|uniref:bifunctional 4-hydroxy-3-methylbut-2-enyl diphosphate reductase/30S ribosomal protein S1 n=1 Tax=Dethiothermospora halolimnae TaxID=3114390 RepID=UPI003CCBC8D2